MKKNLLKVLSVCLSMAIVFVPVTRISFAEEQNVAPEAKAEEPIKKEAKENTKAEEKQETKEEIIKDSNTTTKNIFAEKYAAMMSKVSGGYHTSVEFVVKHPVLVAGATAGTVTLAYVVYNLVTGRHAIKNVCENKELSFGEKLGKTLCIAFLGK